MYKPLAGMNKYASFALAFLLVFSGCLGGSDNDLTTEDNTVEPVGETDFTSLEKDLENLTNMINAEIARLDNLETLVEGIDDSEDTLNALGCEEDEIAAYDGMEWRCAHVQQFLPQLDEAVFSILDDDFEYIYFELNFSRNSINEINLDLEYLKDSKDGMQYDINDLENEISQLNGDLDLIFYAIEDLESDIDTIWSIINNLQERINVLENGGPECEIAPYGNCPGTDFSGYNFSGMNLTGINFHGAILDGANFNDTILDYSILNEASARSTFFVDAHVEYAEWENVNFQYANFTHVYIYDTTMKNSYFDSTELTCAYISGELERASFSNSLNYDWYCGGWNLYALYINANDKGTGASFDNVDYIDSDLVGFDNAYFQNAKCINCSFVYGIKDTLFTGANLTGSEFYGYPLDLTHTDFTSADLTNVSFWDASWNGDKEVRLIFTIFEDATVDGINFSEYSDFYWHQVKWTDGERYDYNPTTTAD